RCLLARAADCGVDWVVLGPGRPTLDLTLRLPADLPVGGRVVDLEGRPVAGAAVRVVELSTSASGALDEFLNLWAADKEKKATGSAFRVLTDKRLWPEPVLQQLAGATTAADGTFRLTGIGRD